jgi:hypothetical protein
MARRLRWRASNRPRLRVGGMEARSACEAPRPDPDPLIRTRPGANPTDPDLPPYLHLRPRCSASPRVLNPRLPHTACGGRESDDSSGTPSCSPDAFMLAAAWTGPLEGIRRGTGESVDQRIRPSAGA